MAKISGTINLMTVGEFNRRVNKLLEQDPELQRVRVKGEISDFKRYPSGHSYFTLKDDEASISCVLFRGSASNVSFTPQSGMKVLISGRPNVYDKTGRFQLIVNAMEEDGVGDLYLAFQQLKKKLSDEGLFSQDRKLPIPYIPQTIVVITSEAGAVIRDIIHVLERRYPGFSLLLIPVPVQGKGAEADIAQAINRANDLKLGDVMIVGRGGGSLEDLQAFNEEVVARAIASSEIPVISAVGHETDYTIADFAADLRAPTPSAAAELVVPNKVTLAERLDQLSSALERASLRKLGLEQLKLKQLRERPVLSQIGEFLTPRKQQIDFLYRRLKQGIANLPQQNRNRLIPLQHRLSRPVEQKLNSQIRLREQLNNQLFSMIKNLNTEKQSQFKALMAGLDALSPLSIVARGYSMTYSGNNLLISSVHDVKEDENINVLLSDGELKCKVLNIKSVTDKTI